MKNKSHLIPFILINVIVSGITTLSVLWLWEQTHPSAVSSQTAKLMDPGDPSQPTITDPSDSDLISETETSFEFLNEDFEVAIRVIVGAGDLNIEYAEIVNKSPGAIDLTGWQLVDEDDRQFIFPALILNSGGAIKVLSRQGENTVIELYWQADEPVWQFGETANLIDATGALIATYSLP